MIKMQSSTSQKCYFFGLVLGMIVLSLGVRALARSFEIEPTYKIEFTSDNPSGSFTGLKGNIQFDPEDLSGSLFDVTVDATTIDLGNSLKEMHAKGNGYFDVAHFPQIAFKSSKIEALEAGFQVHGALTLKGITKEIQFPFTFEKNEAGEKVFQGEFDIQRLDFGIGGNAEKPSKTLHVKLYVPVK